MKIVFKIIGGLLVTLLVAAAAGYWFLFGRGAELGEGIILRTWSSTEIEGIPVALDVDPSGRVWVVETNQFTKGVGDMRYQTYWAAADMLSESTEDRLAYIEKSIADGDLNAEFFDNDDVLRLIEDNNNDGTADASRVVQRWQGYLDGVAAGVLVKGNDIWVTNVPNVWKLTDEAGDLSFSKKEVLSTGWGLRTAFVGHDMHGLTWGPDGKIYFSIGDRGFNVTNQEGINIQPPMDQGRGGVLRMNPDGSQLELFHVGLRNPQELAFDNYGNLITADNNSDGGDEARIVYVTEGGDSGWTYGYQYMADEDYLRGPWNAEKLWHPAHEGQAAWIVPALANYTNGPSGVAHYPGLGLPDRYNNHFFVANYSFVPLNSYILSFEIEPEGAGFTLNDVHRFVDGELVIDQGFGYDGKLYAISAFVFGGDKNVLQIYGEDQHNDPEIQQHIAEVGELFRNGLDTLSTEKLINLLSHIDQRVRLHSQYELAQRAEIAALTNIANATNANELARIHAIWALGQIGERALRGWSDFSGFEGEVRAQAIKVAGDSGAQHLLDACLNELKHGNPRVQYFAAISAGKLAANTANSKIIIEPITQLLERNNNADVFIRHASIFALHRQGDVRAIADLASHKSVAVRLAAVVALRKFESDALVRFLQDNDRLVVTEAARAIHDLRLTNALPALAALATTDLNQDLGSDSEPEADFALDRRVINANLLVGNAESAGALAQYAARKQNPLAMRKLALETLAVFATPPRADFVWGDHQIIAPRAADVAHKAIDSTIAKMLDGELGELAMDVALAHGRVPLDDKALATLIDDSSAPIARRESALLALASRKTAASSGLLDKVLARTVNDADESLRTVALSAAAKHNPASAANAVLAKAKNGTSTAERQAAIALLPQVANDKAVAWLKTAIADPSLPAELRLDVVLAAEKVPALEASINAWRTGLRQKGPFAEQQLALSGGNHIRGKALFGTGGDCLRCHIVNGKGGVAGPDLTGAASKYTDQYLLDALVQPGKDLAPGYANVVLTLNDGSSVNGVVLEDTATEIALQIDTGHGEPVTQRFKKTAIQQQLGPFSGMPPMGLALPLKDVRDLMAYLKTLK